MAAQGNNPNLIIYFKIKYNISVLSQDAQGNTPLHWACYNSSEEAINFLLSYMTDIKDINIKNKDGKTPLHISVLTEKPSLIKKLIKRGADINIKDKDGKTPIDLAQEITGIGTKKEKSLIEKISTLSCTLPDNNFFQREKENNTMSKVYLITYFILLFLELFSRVIFTIRFFAQFLRDNFFPIEFYSFYKLYLYVF